MRELQWAERPAGTRLILDDLNGGVAGHYHLDRLVSVVHRLVHGPLGYVDEIACLELQGSGQPVAYKEPAPSLGDVDGRLAVGVVVGTGATPAGMVAIARWIPSAPLKEADTPANQVMAHDDISTSLSSGLTTRTSPIQYFY